MTLPVTQRTLNRQIEDFSITARNLKLSLTEQHARMAAGNVSANLILGVFHEVQPLINDGAALKLKTGINDHLKTQWEDDTLDFATEAQAVIEAAQAVATAADTLIPKDDDGWHLIQKTAGGAVETRAFAEAQTAPLRTAIDTLLALLV